MKLAGPNKTFSSTPPPLQTPATWPLTWPRPTRTCWCRRGAERWGCGATAHQLLGGPSASCAGGSCCAGMHCGQRAATTRWRWKATTPRSPSPTNRWTESPSANSRLLGATTSRGVWTAPGSTLSATMETACGWWRNLPARGSGFTCSSTRGCCPSMRWRTPWRCCTGWRLTLWSPCTRASGWERNAASGSVTYDGCDFVHGVGFDGTCSWDLQYVLWNVQKPEVISQKIDEANAM